MIVMAIEPLEYQSDYVFNYEVLKKVNEIIAMANSIDTDTLNRNNEFGNFENSVALGQAEGYQSLFLFGRNDDIDSSAEEEFVAWGDYTFQSTAAPFYVSSTNASDVGLVYVVLALDDNWEQHICTVVTNGQNGVQLVAPTGETNFIRANIMFNSTPSETASLGDIYLGTEASPVGGEPADPNKVLLAGVNEQQSNQAVFSVPSTHTALLKSVVVTTNRNSQGGNSDIYLNTRQVGVGSWRRRTEAGVQVSGSSVIDYNLPFPVNLASKTDIKLSASVSSNNTALAGGFQLLLVDNSIIV